MSEHEEEESESRWTDGVDGFGAIELVGEGAGCLGEGLGCSLSLLLIAAVGLPWMM
ncbi:hypothetical protein [Allosphingosinicella deserti]|uniref:hypothetical protein n=1 Tax=Allosphingosinicella deserti TaxID=2116704 RepID=UPI001304B52D|nr:hypothetical protein [Sphingomonas deserti]